VRATDQAVVVPLSARTVEQLRVKAADLLRVVREADVVDLLGVAHTLQMGRQEMEERACFVVRSLDELATRLRAYVDGETAIEGLHQGSVRHRKRDASADVVTADAAPPTISAGWVKGAEVDWRRLPGGDRPRRVRLPVYPFAQERYWADQAGPRTGANGHGANGASGLVEDVLEKIARGLIDESDGVRLLSQLV
jgi:acyl transferase domain-containing protein